MKGPGTAAVDRIVTEVIAPALKARGFRRRGRLWTHASGAVHRGLNVQRSELNDSYTASFTLNVRFAFLDLGDEPFLANGSSPIVEGYRIGPYIPAGDDHWWEIRNPRSGPTADAFVQGFARDWDELVLPLLDSADDPRRFCIHLVRHGPLSGVSIAFHKAQQLGDPDLVGAAFDRALQLARRHEPSPQDPEDRVKVVGILRCAPRRLHSLYGTWERVSAMAQRAGRQLEGPDHERAVDALGWAAEVYMPSPEARPSDWVEARAFAARLGLDPATLDLTPDALRQ